MAKGPRRDPHERDPRLTVPAVLARLAAVALAASWLAYEWHRWPNGTALLGPLGFVWFDGPSAGNLACCGGALLAVFAFPLHPSRLTAAVSVLGLLAWTFLGTIAHGIGC